MKGCRVSTNKVYYVTTDGSLGYDTTEATSDSVFEGSGNLLSIRIL